MDDGLSSAHRPSQSANEASALISFFFFLFYPGTDDLKRPTYHCHSGMMFLGCTLGCNHINKCLLRNRLSVYPISPELEAVPVLSPDQTRRKKKKERIITHYSLKIALKMKRFRDPHPVSVLRPALL